MRRRGPTGEISFSFGERKHILSMVIIDVAANMGESKRRSLGFPPKGQVACKQGAMWLCLVAVCAFLWLVLSVDS